MCGIAGIFNLERDDSVAERDIRQMLAMLRHRGPDQFGIYLDGPVGLGNARLSIIDVATGQQPISNEDGSLWIVFNGEIFNYPELRLELEARGHRFTTKSDTEVLLHAFEEFGSKCLEQLNGQFACAIWDAKRRSLFLARDRLGVRPLFYTFQNGTLVFGSEIKALLASRRISAEIDPVVLDQVFTFWAPLPGRTVFRGICEVPAGHFLVAHANEMKLSCYWDLTFPSLNELPRLESSRRPLAECEEELGVLLVHAAKVRLRADVSVGAYLSGGLDSSIIASIVRNFTTNKLDTFSIAFDEPSFDESEWQRSVARFLGTGHQVVQAKNADIANVFPEVVWHAEVPLLRTAPAPMFLLSKLVRDSGYKVVLTGEGADEFLAGYDIFKEAKIRRFWASEPDSPWRPLLFKRLYSDIGNVSKTNPAYLAGFFRQNLTDTDSPDYSHAVRWRNCRRNRRFFSQETAQRAATGSCDFSNVRIPEQFGGWSALSRAQYLETKIFLSQYLLSSQGDRMAMAHSVEGRYPFLDCRVVDFCNRLPPEFKLRGMTEKYLLKQLGRRWLPQEISQRPKRPYRAPVHRCFFERTVPEYVEDLLSVERIKESGWFKAEAVAQLVRKVRQGGLIGELDDMALAGILSTQLLHSQFVSRFEQKPPLSEEDDVKVCHGTLLSPVSRNSRKEAVTP